ncbi:MAG: hypothetical protein ACXWC2_15460 [Ramlibacter sp.]
MAARPPSKPPAEPFFPGDRATAPMALEETSDSAWHRFEALQKSHDVQFAPTEPGHSMPSGAGAFQTTLPAGREAPVLPPPVPAARRLTVDEVMLVARRNNRACPLPARWAELHALLPAHDTRGGALQAPPPIDGPAWDQVSPMQKRLRVRDHIEWADRGGVLREVHDFLARLPEDEWLHFG